MKLSAHELPYDIKTLQTMLLAERQRNTEQEQLIARLQQQLVQFGEDVRL
ncbi:hypothetical protein [Parashewanella curva]|nr:hypothetical protein [Parashewanella curva]